MVLITIIILIILIVYLLQNNKSIRSLLNLNLNLKEGFIITTKDRQKIGTSDMEDGRQPKSTWRSGNVNYESCYTTETRNGNSTGRKGSYYCNNGIDGGEVIPAEGLYSLDLSNYTVHPGKAIRGKPLTGTYSGNNSKSYTLTSDGIVSGSQLTLFESKSLCDALKDKCLGFIMVIPVNGGYQHQTIFISKIDEGWEDPDTYAKLAKLDDTNTSIVSYVKKDPFAIEKSVPQQQINATSEKYRNLPTCNWKSANRCIFTDYTYDQPSNSCVSKDGNPAFNTSGYTREQLTEWLKTVYNRDMGVNKLASEAVNVRNYIERCKDIDSYEFLATLNLPNPYTPTTKQGDVRGRYVRISINNKTNNWLHLAELQVISNNRNIALGKPTSTSSVYGGASSNRANDGNNDGNFNNGSVSHTENTGNPEFWEVDLGDSAQTIDRIIVSNRTDGGGERLNNWLLSIYDNNKNLVWARIYAEAPNPRSVIDIVQAHNDMSNIKVKDYNQSRFNNYFYRVSNTEYNSKRGWDGKGCYDQCHKEICEGEKKKWIGNNDWYGCRDYRPGEYDAELKSKESKDGEDEYTALYNGKLYRVLGGQHKKNDTNRNSGMSAPLPPGWSIADDNEDSFKVTQMHQWGTNGLVVKSGFPYYTAVVTGAKEPIFGRNFHSLLFNSNNNFNAGCGPCAVLITKPASSSGGNQCQLLSNGIPDFNCTFGNMTSGTSFELNGWKLVSNVGTYGNEGLPAILSSVPPPLNNTLNNYPRMAGFLRGSNVIIGIIGPTAKRLKGFNWYGSANYGSNRNAKDISLWASNNDYSNDLSAASSGSHVYTFGLPQENITTQNPHRVNFNPVGAFRAYYFQIRNNYGDSSVKVGSIDLIFE